MVDLPALPESTEIRYLTMPQVQALANAAVPGEHQQLDRALYLTAAMTGLRQGELIALRWQDIAWEDRRVRVVRNHVLGQLDTPKSRRSARSVPLSSNLATELRGWQRATRWNDPDALVFAEPASGNVLRARSAHAPLPPSAQGSQDRSPPLPRPTPHVRDGAGRRWRADADPAGVDGSSRHRHDPTLCRLRSE
jgi:integrase